MASINNFLYNSIVTVGYSIVTVGSFSSNMGILIMINFIKSAKLFRWGKEVYPLLPASLKLTILIISDQKTASIVI